MDAGIIEKLEFIYGKEVGQRTGKKLKLLLEQWKTKLPRVHGSPNGGIPADEGDAVMIGYGDNIQDSARVHLDTLRVFAEQRLRDVISGIHILPFSPYSSDDGFSVMDYRQINPEWGSWDHISAIASSFRLMADLVLNHCSSQGKWFKNFLEGADPYKNFFITVAPDTDLSAVFRPRSLPLTHEFEVAGEKKQVWTTFSEDQVDLNFANPDVCLEFVDILLDYVSKGVQLIRLDAVGFLWKEIGTSCMHHPKTHVMIKLFRLILASTAPGVLLITETNVPHKENISYFGKGNDEAHMVYQFALPPLVLDAFIHGNSSKLTTWAMTLPKPNPHYTFFNFLASHDGIGLLPTRGYLDDSELNKLIDMVKERGGLVSYKATPDGEVPYELNVSYLDAIAEQSLSVEKRATKFLSSQAVMLAMAGVPGIYIHSLLGSGNWSQGVNRTGINRAINREKLDYKNLLNELDDEKSLRGRIFDGFKIMLKARRKHRAFHPSADQIIYRISQSVFALMRIAADGKAVLCLQSLSGDRQVVKIPKQWIRPTLRNIIDDTIIRIDEGCVEMDPWAVLWLE